jgi:hypothetical protein
MATTPSRAQIDDASTTLDATARATWLALIRQCDRYRNARLGYRDLEGVIEAAAGTLKAKQLNAALTLIDSIGSGEIEIADEGAKISKPKDREALVDYAIAVLYDEPTGPFLSGKRVTSGTVRSPAVW